MQQSAKYLSEKLLPLTGAEGAVVLLGLIVLVLIISSGGGFFVT